MYTKGPTLKGQARGKGTILGGLTVLVPPLREFLPRCRRKAQKITDDWEADRPRGQLVCRATLDGSDYIDRRNGDRHPE